MSRFTQWVRAKGGTIGIIATLVAVGIETAPIAYKTYQTMGAEIESANAQAELKRIELEAQTQLVPKATPLPPQPSYLSKDVGCEQIKMRRQIESTGRKWEGKTMEAGQEVLNSGFLCKYPAVINGEEIE